MKKWKPIDPNENFYKHYIYVTTLCVVNATNINISVFLNTLFTYWAQKSNIYNLLRSECVIDKTIC